MTCSRQTLSCGSPAQAVFLTDAGDSLLEGFETNSVPIHYLRFKDPKKILGRPGWGREKKRKKKLLGSGRRPSLDSAAGRHLAPPSAAAAPLARTLPPEQCQGGDTSH